MAGAGDAVRMSKALDLAYQLQKWLWRVVRLRTRGVKVMLFNDRGEVLLIRNSYGRSDRFVLPGGGVRPWEEPGAAAARELREEVGIEVARLQPVSIHMSSAEGKRDTIHLFQGLTGEDPTTDGLEVEEAQFFCLDDLPAKTSAATRRRLSEYCGQRAADGSW
jgi:8-oxo-dGTP pyrophosphatase MutT (NUDIX family)